MKAQSQNRTENLKKQRFKVTGNRISQGKNVNCEKKQRQKKRFSKRKKTL